MNKTKQKPNKTKEKPNKQSNAFTFAYEELHFKGNNPSFTKAKISFSRPKHDKQVDAHAHTHSPIILHTRVKSLQHTHTSVHYKG